MDPLSIIASVCALAESTLAVVEYLHDVKDGGKQRFKLLAEITSLWNVLDNLEKTLDALDLAASESWMRAVVDLGKPGGALKECERLVTSLLEKLKPNSRQNKVLAAIKWPFEKQEAQTTIEQAHRLQTAIAVALGQSNILLSTHIREETSATRKLLNEQEARVLLDWLSPLNFNSQQEAIYKQYCVGTGNWLLESQNFKTWLAAEESLLWCAGIAGSGKTSLASLIVHQLREDAQSSKNLVLVGYCRFDDPVCQKPSNIVGALIKQTIHEPSDIPKELEEVYAAHRQNGTRPDLDSLQSILSNQIARHDKVYVIIDALDELIAVKDKEALLKCLRGIERSLNLLIMSRELVEILNLLRPVGHCCDSCDLVTSNMLYHCDFCAMPHGPFHGGFDACEPCHETGVRCPDKTHPPPNRVCNGLFENIEAHQSDVMHYLAWRISSDSGLSSLVRKKKGLQEELINDIVKSSQSMFLLAKLAIDNLATCLTIRDIRKCLKEVPEGLQAAYDQTLARIDQQDRHRSALAREVLKWVLMAARPLTCAEMEQAVVIEPEMDEIDLDDIVPASTLVSLCAGLLLIDYDGYIRWIHYTAEEYFKAQADSLFPNGNSSLTETCLTFLSLDVFTSGPCEDKIALEERQQAYPFFQYAVLQWNYHIMKEEQILNKDLAISFLESDNLRTSAVQCLWDLSKDWEELEHSSSVPALHFAVYLGLDFAVQHFLDQDSDVNTDDGTGWTPLTLAAQGNHTSIARLLLAHGADVNLIASSGAAAIHIAAFNGYAEFMDALLEVPDINVNLLLSPNKESALMFAARAGHLDLVKKLLSCPNIDVDVQSGRDSSTALEIAMENKREGIASLLLGAHTHIVNSDRPRGRSTLIKAVQNDQLELIELLVTKGADLEQSDERGLTPLLIAAKRGKSAKLFNCLLKLGANSKAVTSSGNSLLHIAAANAEVLRICFQRKLELDINARQKGSGRTPLHQAVLWGRDNTECIRLLVENGADITIRDTNNKMTAWDYADRRKDREAAEFLKFTVPEPQSITDEDVPDNATTPESDSAGPVTLQRREFSFDTSPDSPPPPYEENELASRISGPSTKRFSLPNIESTRGTLT